MYAKIEKLITIKKKVKTKTRKKRKKRKKKTSAKKRKARRKATSIVKKAVKTATPQKKTATLKKQPAKKAGNQPVKQTAANKRPYTRSPRMESIMKRADELEKKGMTRREARKTATKDWNAKHKRLKKLKQDNDYMEKVNGNNKPYNTTKRCMICGEKAMTGSDVCFTCQDGCESMNGAEE